MAICLEYQTIYYRRQSLYFSYHLHVLTGLILLLALSAKVWVRNETTDVGYRLAQERTRMQVLDDERRERELQLSVLKRPDNLSRQAQKRLGLVPLNPRQAWKVEE